MQRTETCWLWTGAHKLSGAGTLPVRDGGRVQQVSAARLSWELHVGPVPAGRRLWRRCRRPACVRPDHLVLVRRSRAQQDDGSDNGTPTHTLVDVHRAAVSRSDARRTWWTRERVLAGLLAFHHDTRQTPTTSRGWTTTHAATAPQQRRYPSAYAVLRHFPSFRAAWMAAGIPLIDAHWAPWTSAEERYLVATLGVRPTAEIAATLGRGEAAVRTRARHLGLHVTDAHGWPIQRAARVAGVSEHVLRGYIDRGELCVFKGAKNVYVDVADLVVVDEFDWQRVPPALEIAALHSLRWRLVQVLAGRDWRTLRPHRPCPAEPTTRCGRHRLVPRSPRPASIGAGTWVQVIGSVPALPQCAGRVGQVQRLFWSTHTRQHEQAPQWRAAVVFSKERRRQPGADIVYSLPLAALEATAPPAATRPSWLPLPR